MKQRLGDERDYIDFMTDMGFSSNLLEAMNIAISKPEWREMPIGTFYGLWMKKNCLGEVISPYNFGVVVAELYCGLVFAKENWIDLLPDENFDDIDDSFGIKTTSYSFPAKAKPKLRDVVRRIRNSLSHSNFKIELPEHREYLTLFNKAKVLFEDINPRNPQDTFSIELQVEQLKVFYGVYRDLVFKAIVEKDGGFVKSAYIKSSRNEGV